MHNLLYVLLVIFIFMLVFNNMPAYRSYSPNFQGANIVWIILIVILVLYLLRWLPGI